MGCRNRSLANKYACGPTPRCSASQSDAALARSAVWVCDLAQYARRQIRALYCLLFVHNKVCKRCEALAPGNIRTEPLAASSSDVKSDLVYPLSTTTDFPTGWVGSLRRAMSRKLRQSRTQNTTVHGDSQSVDVHVTVHARCYAKRDCGTAVRVLSEVSTGPMYFTVRDFQAL
jgi:hypothetical protein